MSSVEEIAEPRAGFREPQAVEPMRLSRDVKAPNTIRAADCGCAECAAKASAASSGAGSTQLVFALGQIGHDLQTEARRDSLAVHMEGQSKDPSNPLSLLDYLENAPWEAASVLWTLNLDQTPIYGIQPAGPFASQMYHKLREAYREQIGGTVERVSLPGRLVGQARLLTGQLVSLVQPEIRGFYSWNTAALLDAVCGARPTARATARERVTHQQKSDGVRRFLDRVSYELRNLGLTSQDRAINYAAANAFQFEQVYEQSAKSEMELDEILVERSPICRPESDCWDVVLAFFYPGKPQPAVRRHFRFTVDVSDVVPVLVGPVREWHTR